MILETFDALYPGYYFRKNKGYGTKRHIQAIHDAGICPVHRRSYEPVKSLVSSGGNAE
jgi:ribonuclease HII